MYLSQLLIDTGTNPDRPRPGRLWLRNRYRIHQRLCMAFPSDPRKKSDPEFLAPYKPEDFPEQRHLADQKKHEVGHDALKQVHSPRNDKAGFLLRIDPLPNGRAVIIVQSSIEPDWGYAFRNANYLLAAPPEVKPFEPRFSKGQCLRFRLAANPTRRLSKHSPDAKEESIGKRVPVPTDQLIDWLARRAESAGFFVERDATTIQTGYIYMNKNGKGQRLRSVLFDGLLRVTDTNAFLETLVRGIGAGKAFGFGLLSVAPVPNSGSENAT
ncbi:putative CRISPR-associated protein, Cse3 family [uncultured Desulfobacterium sp.]|uniref:Putative CRISPR-associated protein, Cse3 family n=1 Tax=uncultured Desulfobacterium sp. TaxID=201089 RepID=A0A445N0J0_9BACT|nr:putative CRISPR-associated protein, Cse3 family [uncultured Desulfobacterium sp.]